MAETILQYSSQIVILFALCIGLSAALVAWLISRAVAEVPSEDREYKDPPPIGFRIVWWPIQWVNFYCFFFKYSKSRDKKLAQLRQAGLDFTVTPEQFTSARIVWAAIAAAFGYWIVSSFDVPKPGGERFSNGVYMNVCGVAALFGWVYPAMWLKDRIGTRRRELLKSLPFYLDIITLCVEAGLNLQGAINQSVAKGPKGVLRDEFQRVLRDIRAGKARADSLRNMAERLNEPSATNFTTAVIQAESMGMNLGPILRAQADQRRTERFLRAEKLAMQAPVKMLFPLIAFIFPCTFIVLLFPIVVQFIYAGK